MMTQSKLVKRRRWMVVYSIPNGTGRIFMTSNDVPLSEELIVEFDEYIRENTSNPTAFVTAATPLEIVYEEPPEDG